MCVPDVSVSSVQHQYRYRKLRKVRYGINTGTGHFGMFGTISIPVSAVPDMHACTEACTGIGTALRSVPNTWVGSAQHQPGIGLLATFGTISIRQRHILTLSVGALAPGRVPSHAQIHRSTTIFKRKARQTKTLSTHDQCRKVEG